MNAPEVGKLIETADARRDAIHVAVAPVEAAEDLEPGGHVILRVGKAVRAEDGADAIGIVDPFLTAPVRAGQRFWLFLLPNSITSLRHVWTHPAFMAVPPGDNHKRREGP